MWQTVEDLMAFSPSLVTCTYGAGGSTRGKTLDIVEGVHRKYGLPVASHLTCVGSSVDELREYLAEALDRGVSGIVALRGDPPKGETEFRPVVGGLSYASELVQLIHTECPSLDIAVAGYPETHQEAMSEEMDLENLKRKCDAGGQAVIVPGVMPVVNFSQVRRIAKLCKAKLPAEFINAMEKAGESESAQFEAGVQFATQQVHELVRAGVPGLHFYVLNRSPATAQVLQQVGISGKN